ncbi:MAG: hypothetical protein NWQ54_20050 [Paraglaciecola sp.]|nr:hypothetical protein [Paraglaciecola sp.]
MSFLTKIIIFLLTIFALLFWTLTIPGKIAPTLLAAEDIVEAREVFANVFEQVRRADSGVEIKLTQQELDAVFSIANYTFKPVVWRGNISNAGVAIEFVYALPPWLGERLLHIYCFFYESPRGFVVDQCKVGKIAIPGKLANFLVYSAIKLLFDTPSDQQMLSLLNSGAVRANQITFQSTTIRLNEVGLNPQLYSGASSGMGLLGLNNEFAPDLTYYLDALEQLTRDSPKEHRLAYFMQKLLILAQSRADQTDLPDEYANVMWALAVGFGNKAFGRIANRSVSRDDIPSLRRVTLAGRQDLALHFLYSAVLKNVGNSAFAGQIGSIKEFNDSMEGGSGFSFVDMAANKAGIHFVTHLAQINSEIISTLSVPEFEKAFFPSITGLPEGIREQQFQQQFGGLAGQKVIELNGIIEQRLADLSLYNK